MTGVIANYMLRPVREGDSELLLRWRNADHIRPFMYTDHLISESEHRQWFARMMGDESSAYFILEGSGGPLGMVCFTGIDENDRSAVMGCYLGETDAPRGSGTAMGYLALEWIFSNREVRQVRAEVLDFNEASRRFFTRLGFEETDVLPGKLERRGRKLDVIKFNVEREGWMSNHRPRLRERLEADIRE